MNLKYTNMTATGEKKRKAPFDKEIVDTIVKVVSEFTGAPVEKIMAKDRTIGARKRPTVVARHLSMYFAIDIYHMGVDILGDYIGGRDHSSVIHANDTINGLIDCDRSFKNKVESIRKLIFATRNALTQSEVDHEWEPSSIEKNLDDFKAIQNEQ
jgi:chromosomal replication initiation ATPase DnaA